MPTPTARLARTANASGLTVALLLAAAALPALAVYKVVNPDGSVTYTDREPPPGAARVVDLGRGAVGRQSAPQLPLELRTAIQRYPVTLYSAPDCAPCDSGRRLLQQRGVPYTERLVSSEDDTLALQRIVGARTVPTLMVGTQPLRGLAEADWGAYLDVAGYPRESRLPAGWQQPEPTPLVSRAAVPAPGPARRPLVQPTLPPASEAPPEAPPSGIRF